MVAATNVLLQPMYKSSSTLSGVCAKSGRNGLSRLQLIEGIKANYKGVGWVLVHYNREAIGWRGQQCVRGIELADLVTFTPQGDRLHQFPHLRKRQDLNGTG